MVNDPKDYYRNLNIDEIALTVRSYNCLVSAGYKTVGDVANAKDYELLRIDSLGRGSLKDIRDAIADAERGGIYSPDRHRVRWAAERLCDALHETLEIARRNEDGEFVARAEAALGLALGLNLRWSMVPESSEIIWPIPFHSN